MSRRIATGIDIGTHQTKVVVVEEVQTDAGPELHIIGTGIAESRGMRHGYVVDAEDAAESVRQARAQAEQVARVPIRKGFLAIGGVSLDEVRATGEAIIALMFELNRERGSTLVLVTHDPSIARRCGRTITIAAGRIVPPAH